MNRGREQGFGCTYTLSGVWTGGSGGGGGGSNEWTSHYDYIGAPGISLSVSPNLIALTETATAKVKLHGGAEGSEYTISLASVDPVPATEPVGAVTFPDGSSVTVTTESRTGSKTVRGDRIGYLGVEASSPGAKNSPTTQPITVVGVEKLQYKVSGEGGSAEWTDVPELMYVIKGTEITFRAVRNPEGDTWPSGRPEWEGTAGASGDGATKAITFDTVSTSPGDYKTIVASCGNTVTAMVVVVDFEVKMEPVEQFEGRNQSALGVGELADLWVETTPSLDPTSLGTWTWERVSGPAVVTGYTDGTATMEAGATAGKVSVKASLLTPLGGKPQARVLQEVGVKIPESVRYEQAPGSKVVHQKGIPSIGMIMYIYLMPSDVSFKRNGQYREGEVPANESVQTGWYAKKYPNGFRHEPWDPVPIMTPKNNEEGNLVKIVDEVASGRGQNDPELNEQNKSEFTWKIPAQFRSGAAAWQTVETITHHSTMHPNGDMDLEKDGVKVSTKINDDTVESYR